MVVSGPFDRLTSIRRWIAFGVQRAVVLLSIWRRIRSIRERIGVAGVANAGEGGHFDSVDGMRPVDRVEVAIGAGGRL